MMNVIQHQWDPVKRHLMALPLTVSLGLYSLHSLPRDPPIPHLMISYLRNRTYVTSETYVGYITNFSKNYGEFFGIYIPPWSRYI